MVKMVTDFTMAAAAGASLITVFSRHNLLQAPQQSPRLCVLIQKPGFCLS